MQVMMERDAAKRLTGRIEVDEPISAASERWQTRPRFAGQDADRGGGRNHTTRPANPLEVAPGERLPLRRNHRLGEAHFKPTSTVVTDGLRCFTGVGKAGCVHQPIITQYGRRAALAPAFKWVNTTLGNIKSAITGTYRAIHHKHVPR
jgi:ISXO2-like transposase domain